MPKISTSFDAKQMSEYNKRIGKVIRQYRMYNFMSARILANTLNISLNQMYKYENGYSSISAPTLMFLISHLKIPLKELKYCFNAFCNFGD